MRITRYQDIREGDQVFTSTGVHLVGTVNQYVAWAGVTIVRPDLTEWSAQLGDHNIGRFTIERPDQIWSCPVCGGHRYVMQGFPLGGRLNPRGEDLGTRFVCKDRKCAHSYWVPPGERYPNFTPNPNVPSSTPDLVLSVGDQVTIPRSHWVWKVTSVKGDVVRARNGDGKSTSFSRSDVLDVVERKQRP